MSAPSGPAEIVLSSPFTLDSYVYVSFSEEEENQADVILKLTNACNGYRHAINIAANLIAGMPVKANGFQPDPNPDPISISDKLTDVMSGELENVQQRLLPFMNPNIGPAFGPLIDQVTPEILLHWLEETKTSTRIAVQAIDEELDRVRYSLGRIETELAAFIETQIPLLENMQKPKDGTAGTPEPSPKRQRALDFSNDDDNL